MLLFDCRGSGDSQGDFSTFLLAENDRWVLVDRNLAAYQPVPRHIDPVRLIHVKETGCFMEIIGSEEPESISPLYLQALLEWLHDCLR